MMYRITPESVAKTKKKKKKPCWFSKHCAWEDWFAWRPVIVSQRIAWLKTIQRKYSSHFLSEGWDYKLKDKK